MLLCMQTTQVGIAEIKDKVFPFPRLGPPPVPVAPDPIRAPLRFDGYLEELPFLDTPRALGPPPVDDFLLEFVFFHGIFRVEENALEVDGVLDLPPAASLAASNCEPRLLNSSTLGSSFVGMK